MTRTRRWLPPQRVTTIEVDFGPDETTLATTTITAPWTGADTPITLTPAGAANDDHDPEDALLDEVRAYVTAREEGIGYTVTAYAPNGTWGRHTFHATG